MKTFSVEEYEVFQVKRKCMSENGKIVIADGMINGITGGVTNGVTGRIESSD